MRLHTPLHYGDKAINSPSQRVNKHLLPSHPSKHTNTHLPFSPEAPQMPLSLAHIMYVDGIPSDPKRTQVITPTTFRKKRNILLGLDLKLPAVFNNYLSM